MNVAFRKVKEGQHKLLVQQKYDTVQRRRNPEPKGKQMCEALEEDLFIWKIV